MLWKVFGSPRVGWTPHSNESLLLKALAWPCVTVQLCQKSHHLRLKSAAYFLLKKFNLKSWSDEHINSCSGCSFAPRAFQWFCSIFCASIWVPFHYQFSLNRFSSVLTSIKSAVDRFLVNPELLHINQYEQSVAHFGTNRDLIHRLL